MTETGEQGRGPRRGRGRWLLLAVGLALGIAVATTFAVRGLRDPLRSPPLPVADVSSERLLAQGSVVGLAAAHDTHAWLGIPYARPPVGALRWRAPRSSEAWVDTFDALAFGAPCPQPGSPIAGVPAEDDEGFAGSEDCLSLNVWAPRAEPEAVPTDDARWPVMVWIHGGGNTLGYAGNSMYDGARLAGTQDLVVVSLNYRLGPLGWLSHPALRAEASDALEASGNFGLLDQIAALEWVRENIEEFGGDPTNVTIFGESAGARDVLALLVAEPAAGLFHRAIAQSGSTESVSRLEAEHGPADTPPGHPYGSQEVVAALLAEAGVVPDRAAARSYAAALAPADLVAFLRDRPAREILAAYRSPGGQEMLSVPNVIRDGVLLPEAEALDRLRAGRFHRVPILLGWNRDEWKLFLSQDPEHVSQRFGLVYSIRDPEDYARRARAHSDLWAVRAVGDPAEAILEAGWREVWAYRFDWDALPRVLGQEMSTLLGAAHAFELPFLFGTFDLGDPLLSRLLYTDGTRAEREWLAERMMAYWASFARAGRPGQGGRDDLPEWPAWDAGARDGGTILVLDGEPDGGIRVASAELDRARVVAALEADPALDREARCALLAELASGRSGQGRAELERLAAKGCSGLLAADASDATTLR